MILTTASAALTPARHPLPLLVPRHVLHLERPASVKAPAKRVQAVATSAGTVREMIVSRAAPTQDTHTLTQPLLPRARLESVKVPASRAQAVASSAGTVLGIVVSVSLPSLQTP